MAVVGKGKGCSMMIAERQVDKGQAEELQRISSKDREKGEKKQ